MCDLRGINSTVVFRAGRDTTALAIAIFLVEEMWKRVGVIVLFVLVAVLPARAWDETGHKVVAYIAWQRMTPEARDVVADILRYAPPRSDLLRLRPANGTYAGMMQFVRASNWPDIVRDRTHEDRYERYHEADWHRTNIFWEETPGGVRIHEDLQPQDVNIVERLYRLEELARADLVARAQKAVIIAWIGYLVGEIHQPLHASIRITDREPKGDLGGILFELEEGDNLHLYWDRALSDAYQREVGESEFAFIRRIASSLMSNHSPPSAVDFEYRTWAERGFRIASRDVYDQIERGEEPAVAYQEMTHTTAAESVALAGYRLGELMNSIFG